METTNLDKIKEIFKTLLELRPIQKNEIFVSHPFLTTRVVMTKDKMIDIFEDSDGFKEWKEFFKKRIEKETRLMSLFLHIEKPYRLSVFSYTCDYMGEKDYGEILNMCWTTEEFNSNNPDVTKKEMVSLFKKANKQYLMEEDDYKTYLELPDKITIYRGVRSPKYKKGLAWSLDKDIATWFATRFESDEYYLYEVEIDKKEILAYFNDRDEQEIIINPYNLKKYEIKEMVL